MLKLVVVHSLPKIMVAESEFDPSLVCTRTWSPLFLLFPHLFLEEPPTSSQPQHIFLSFIVFLWGGFPLTLCSSNDTHAPVLNLHELCHSGPRLHYKVVGIITWMVFSCFWWKALLEMLFILWLIFQYPIWRLLSPLQCWLKSFAVSKRHITWLGVQPLFLSDMVDLKVKSFSFRSSGVRPGNLNF